MFTSLLSEPFDQLLKGHLNYSVFSRLAMSVVMLQYQTCSPACGAQAVSSVCEYIAQDGWGGLHPLLVLSSHALYMKACYTLAAKNAVGVALLMLKVCLQSREKFLE